MRKTLFIFLFCLCFCRVYAAENIARNVLEENIAPIDAVFELNLSGKWEEESYRELNKYLKAEYSQGVKKVSVIATPDSIVVHKNDVPKLKETIAKSFWQLGLIVSSVNVEIIKFQDFDAYHVQAIARGMLFEQIIFQGPDRRWGISIERDPQRKIVKEIVMGGLVITEPAADTWQLYLFLTMAAVSVGIPIYLAIQSLVRKIIERKNGR